MLRVRREAEDSLVVTRLGETSWILRPREMLEGHAVASLRDAFLEAVDTGAQNVVVDLSEIDAIATDGAATLVAMADLMLGRNGLLWIAARRVEPPGHTLRPIDAHGANALVGVASALDAALERLHLVELEDRPSWAR